MILKFKQHLREKICKRMNIPYNRHGLPNSLAKHLPQNHGINLFDIGAHDGHFTKMIEGYCGILKGALVEALPDKAKNLKKHFSLPRFIVFECAASAENGVTDFEVNGAKIHHPCSESRGIWANFPT